MTLTVEGMTCDGCKAAVERVASRIPGVTAARVTLADRRLEIEGDPDLDALTAAIVRAGYRVAASP